MGRGDYPVITRRVFAPARGGSENLLSHLFNDGGRSRIRTYGPLIKSQLLYQLSYAPIVST